MKAPEDEPLYKLGDKVEIIWGGEPAWKGCHGTLVRKNRYGSGVWTVLHPVTGVQKDFADHWFKPLPPSNQVFIEDY